jgi:hypothetical protein
MPRGADLLCTNARGRESVAGFSCRRVWIIRAFGSRAFASTVAARSIKPFPERVSLHRMQLDRTQAVFAAINLVTRPRIP